jgi:hypothetical protein
MNVLRYSYWKIVLFLAIGPLSFLARAADPITVVQYPLSMRPAITKAGDSFTIVCAADRSKGGWAAQLFTEFNRVDLVIDPHFDEQSGTWQLKATVPSNTPYELYNLSVQASALDDEVAHAVKVVKEFRDSYYFVHLPDLHLPSVAWIGYYDDDNTVTELKRILGELTIIDPEFVLQTGDVVDNGRDEAQYLVAQQLLSTLAVPLFLTGGNHDLWFDGHDYWHKYFSPVMDYGFSYSTDFFYGMEMYDIPTVTFTAEQMRRLQDGLKQSLARGDRLRTLFYHYDESRQIDADFALTYGLDLILYGHTHINGVQSFNNGRTLNLNTSFTMNDNGEYRLIKISGNSIAEYPVLRYKNLNVRYSPANDGTNGQVTATIDNNNPVPFENGLVKFRVRKDPAGYRVSGGVVDQVISAAQQDVYYVRVNIPAKSKIEVAIQSENPLSNRPPLISSFSPQQHSIIMAGVPQRYTVDVADDDNDPISFRWLFDGVEIPNAQSRVLDYTPDRDLVGNAELTVRASDGQFADGLTWFLEVEEYSNKPKIITPLISFFPHNEALTLSWVEPYPMKARLEYGSAPGQYSGSLPETADGEVTFTPSMIGMGLGRQYCRVTDGAVASDPFPITIESENAALMLTPLGNIKNLAPTFSWERVPGVPYYMVICSDRKILIIEDPETGEFSVEGADPIWAVLTPESSVPYGVPDPTGTFTSVPAPLVPGQSYWWVVLNCYGNSAELTSPVQSGFSKFTVDLPPPDLAPPFPISPENGARISHKDITFKWAASKGATAYHLYPFKIENESGIETARALWEQIISTTDTEYAYPSRNRLTTGKYKWNVAAVAANGLEVPAETREFYYEAPTAYLSIFTFDNKGTEKNESDDIPLPRVTIHYSAIEGVYSAFPASTDLHGVRESVVIVPGTYIFTVEKEGFDTLVDTLTFYEEEHKTLSFRLSPSRSTINGTVVDNFDANVIDAVITAQHNLHQEMVKKSFSDGSGNFTLSLVPGPYQLAAEKKGYKSSPPLSVSVDNGQIKSLQQPLTLEKNTNQVYGTVLNTSQQQVYGANVILQGGSSRLTCLTDANGYFSFMAQEGSWSLGVEKDGFVSPESRQVTVAGGQRLQVSPPLVLKPDAAIILGHVSDGKRNVADVRIKAVAIAGEALSTSSDAYGQFSLNVPSGVYKITAEKAHYSFDQSLQLTLNAGETFSGMELVLTAAQAKVRGKITVDGFTPLADVTVTNGVTSTTSSEGGTYELELRQGAHTIYGQKEGYTSTPPESVTVSPGQVIDGVNFVLTPNASVFKGKITADDQTVEGARVEAHGLRQATAFSNASGEYVLSVEPGEWEIVAAKEGYLDARKETQQIGPGQRFENIDFQLVPNIATVQGKVVDAEAAAPIRDVVISLSSLSLSTFSHADGQFTVNCEPGEYNVTLSKSGYKSVAINSGLLGPNDSTFLNVTLIKLSSRFTGKVRDMEQQAVAEAVVYAVSASDSFATATNADGVFELDVKQGQYTVGVNKTGFSSLLRQEPFSIAAGESYNLGDFALEKQRAEVDGFVKRLNTDIPVQSARIVAASKQGFTGQTTTDENGRFAFLDSQEQPILIPGDYKLIAAKEGFESDTLFSLVIKDGQSMSVELALEMKTGTLSGEVKSDGIPIESATVTAYHQQSSHVSNAVTSPEGTFELTGLSDGLYRISAAKIGFSSPEPQEVPVNSAVQIELTKNTGSIKGSITDAESSQPVPLAAVSVGDGLGNGASTTADEKGYFEITDLPTQGVYAVKVNKKGYAALEIQGVDAHDPTELQLKLGAIYGSIAGRVETEDGLVMEGVFVDLSSPSQVFKDTTGSSGEFSFDNLSAQDYQLSVNKVGYSGDPLVQTIDLWQGGQHEAQLFRMREAKAADIVIIGPDRLSNSEKHQFDFVAKTSDDRNATIAPSWQVENSAALKTISPDGLLEPQADFIGPVALSLRDEYTGASTTKTVNVYQLLQAGNPEIRVSNKSGMTLTFADSSVSQSINLELRYPQFSDVRRGKKDFEVIGDVYELSPANTALLKPARLVLPVDQQQADKQLFIGRWDSQWLEWKILDNSFADAVGLESEIENLGRFAVIAKAEPLAIKQLKISPNPFSPAEGPVEIVYSISSNETSTPEVTLKVYNMIGDLVKSLIVAEPQPRGENVVEWDGFTDFGRMARNGRYVLQLKVKDISGQKETVKPFVLIK